MVQEDSEELIQLINPEQESDLRPEDLPDELSILPIKNTVLFPGVVIPITVTRQKSIRLIKKAYQGNRIVGVVAQKNKLAEEPVIESVIATRDHGDVGWLCPEHLDIEAVARLSSQT